MNTITATITREWLARIISGKKRYEYRGSSDIWESRVKKAGPPPFRLRLINGMRKEAPEATVLVSAVHWDDAAIGIRFTIDRVLETKNWQTEWTRLYADGWVDEEESPKVPASKRKPIVSIPAPENAFRAAEMGNRCVVEIPTDGPLWDILYEKSDSPFVARLARANGTVDVIVQTWLTPFFRNGPTILVVSGRADGARGRASS